MFSIRRLRANNGARMCAIAWSMSAFLGGCAGITSMPPPPRVDETVEIGSRPSTILLPVNIDLSRVERRINKGVPERLLTVDEERRSCVPARYVDVCPGASDYRVTACPVPEIRTQVSPAIDCYLSGSVDRRDFAITASEQFGDAALRFDVPVRARVRISGRGAVGKHVDGTLHGALHVSGYVFPDIAEDWTPSVTVDPEFQWTEEPYAELLGARIPIAAQAEPRVRAAMSQLQSALEMEVERVELQETIEALWKRGFFVEKISDKPEVWIRFSPRNMGFSGFSSVENQFKAHFFVDGDLETFVGKRPPAAESTPLPPLRRGAPSGDFHLYVPVFADYEYSARLLENLLQVGEKQFFDVPVAGRVALTFRDVELYPTIGGAIAVGMRVDVDYSRAGLVDGTGIIWLKANMAIDNDKQMIYPDAIDFGAETDNSILNLIVSIARRTSVRQQIENALTYDFSGDYEQGLAIANAAVNRPLGENVVMAGKITEAGIDKIKATANGIYLGVHTVGELQLRVRKFQ